MSLLLVEIIKVVSEHGDSGQLGHERLNQFVTPLGQTCELAGLWSYHLDQLGDFSAANGAEFQQSFQMIN